jgi:hypothetical protein
MRQFGKVLVPGLRPNHAVRRQAAFLICVKGILWIFIFCLAVGSLNPLVLVSAAVVTLAAIIVIRVSVRTLTTMPEVMVLKDGLEVGHRFVPFESITALDVDDGHSCLTIHYTYHGLSQSCLVWVWAEKGRIDKEFAVLTGLSLNHAPEPGLTKSPT